MKNKGKIIGIVVLLAAVLAGAGVGYRYLSEQYGKAEGNSITEIEQDSFAEKQNGETEKVTEDDSAAGADADAVGNGGTETGEPEEETGDNDAAGADASSDGETEPGEQEDASGNQNTAEEESDIENNEESDTSEAESESQEIMAPDFSMTDENGEKVSLSDYFGKPVMLNFWATWCGPCKMEMPHFDKAYQEYQDRMNFLIVDLTDGSRDTVESASAFIEEEGYSFPIFFDTEGEGAYTYGIDSIPTTFFINADGTLEAYQIGALTEELLMGQLEKMVGQEAMAG